MTGKGWASFGGAKTAGDLLEDEEKQEKGREVLCGNLWLQAGVEHKKLLDLYNLRPKRAAHWLVLVNEDKIYNEKNYAKLSFAGEWLLPEGNTAPLIIEPRRAYVDKLKNNFGFYQSASPEEFINELRSALEADFQAKLEEKSLSTL